ncbi:FecR domain-containing protein [Rapidithrix thailandica]|uniref:FecR domain-containing protein n=1 Tax=Rapidithrix thailandica TaxID=413964 RepID=A0AAW9RZ90_9BACT
MREKDTDILPSLFAKYLMDTLSEEEEQTLKHWLEIDAYQQLFEQVKDKKNLESRQHFLDKVDVNADWLQVQTQLTKKVKETKTGKVQRLYAQWIKYVAVLFLIALGTYVGKRLWTEKKAATMITALGDVQPGSKQAVLILPNGERVNLENTDQQIVQHNGVKAINKNNQLTYESVEEGSSSGTVEVSYNTLFVPIGGEYQLQLPDGTKVWLNSASTLKYPTRFVGEKRMVELEGEAYFEVVKDHKQFVVNTREVDVAVLGTSFNVSAYANDREVATTLVEGHVAMSSNMLGGRVDLLPGKRGVYNRAQKSIEVHEVDTDIYTSWKDGKFYFEREKLGNIITKLGRWYRFEAKYMDSAIKNKTFTGVVLKKHSLGYLLNIIESTTNVTFEMRDQQLIISSKKTLKKSEK